MAPNTTSSRNQLASGADRAQIASSNATANAFLGARAQPSWLNLPSAASRALPANPNPPPSAASIKPAPQAKRGRPRKYPPVSLPTAPQPRPEPHFQPQPPPQSGSPQIQTTEVQPAQTILPSPAPSDEPSPALSNALDSPNPLPASLSDAPTPASNMTPASAATNIPMTHARFELDPAVNQNSWTPQPDESWPPEIRSLVQAPSAHAPSPQTSNNQLCSVSAESGNAVGAAIDQDGGCQSTNGAAAPTPQERRRTDTVPLKCQAFEAQIHRYVNAHGGMTAMNARLDRPRIQLLVDACKRNDYFFLALHQLYAIWSINRQDAHRILKKDDVADIIMIDLGFTTVAEILKRNDQLTPTNLRFFASFPVSVDQLREHPVPRATMKSWVGNFLRSMVTEHVSLTQETCMRRYPYVLDELQGRLLCYSPIMREILFTANRRRLGIPDGVHAQALDNAFKEDQERRMHQACGACVAVGDSPETIIRINQALIARYQELVKRSDAEKLRLNQHPPVRLGVPSPPVVPSQQFPPPQPTSFHSPAPSPVMQYSASPQYQATQLHQAQLAQQMVSQYRQQQTRELQAAQLPQSPLQQIQHIQQQRMPLPQQIQYQQQQFQQRPQIQQQFQQQLFEQQQVLQRGIAHQTQQHQQLHELQPDQQRRHLERPYVAPINTQIAQVASPQLGRASLAPTTTPTGFGVPRPVLDRQQPAAAAVQITSQSTAQRAASTPRQPDLLIPAKDVTIPRPEWPYEPTDRRSLAASLHQSGCRSPKRVPKDGTPERLFQAMDRFAIPPSLVRPQGSVYEFSFDVTAEQFDLAVRTARPTSAILVPFSTHFDGALRWRLRCCKLGPSRTIPAEHEWVTKEMSWPRNIFMRFNDKTLEARRQPHNGKDLATELTDHVVCGSNKLSIVVPVSGEKSGEHSYVIAVEVIETVGERTAVRRAWDNGLLPEEHTLQIIRKRLTPVSDDDGLIIEAPDLPIDMADPFTAKMFAVPARGASCTHLECFDLLTWLETRPSKPTTKCFHSITPGCGCPSSIQSEPSNPDKWRCPICLQDARPNSLRIDGFLCGVREQLAQQNKLQTKSIHVKADGTWTAVVESDDDDLSETDTPAAVPSGSSTRKRKASSTPTTARRLEVRREVEVIEID
ncbi:Putative protein of unknown function [Podospora comata]|uniref:SP-RING-type domain-containing protein n=1 Tax=Podospora comata TaxID=48703 RepID=A0ABY6S554_PODCO|nr:Putative protein of unknown function [Podospora comata]